MHRIARLSIKKDIKDRKQWEAHGICLAKSFEHALEPPPPYIRSRMGASNHFEGGGVFFHWKRQKMSWAFCRRFIPPPHLGQILGYICYYSRSIKIIYFFFQNHRYLLLLFFSPKFQKEDKNLFKKLGASLANYPPGSTAGSRWLEIYWFQVYQEENTIVTAHIGKDAIWLGLFKTCKQCFFLYIKI